MYFRFDKRAEPFQRFLFHVFFSEYHGFAVIKIHDVVLSALAHVDHVLVIDLDAVAVFHVDDAVRHENKRRLRQVHHGRIIVANFRKPARAANDNNQRNRHIHDKQR